MAQASTTSPIMSEKTTVTINSSTIGFKSSLKIILKTLSFFFLGRTFKPYFSWFDLTSLLVSPFLSTFNFSKTSSVSNKYQLSFIYLLAIISMVSQY